MNKFNTHIIKKSIKPLMMFSVIATLLMAAMGTTATNMNASAFNFGLKSKDVNSGSIDTISLFSCVGAAINCVNTNQDNNNVVANNTAAVGNGNGILTCEECFEEHLTEQQIIDLAVELEVADLATICAGLDATALLDALIAIGVVDLSVIAALFACLDLELPTVLPEI